MLYRGERPSTGFKKFSYIKELRQIRGSPPLPRAASMRKCASFFHPIRWLPFRHDRTTDRRQSDRRQPSPADSPTRDRAPPAPARSRPGGDPGRHRSGLRSMWRTSARTARKSAFSPRPTISPAETSQDDLLALIDRLNDDPAIDGIPGPATPARPPGRLPAAGAYPPDKDVDGFHPYNIGRLAQRMPLLRPCTPKGIMTLLASTAPTCTAWTRSWSAPRTSSAGPWL